MEARIERDEGNITGEKNRTEKKESEKIQIFRKRSVGQNTNPSSEKRSAFITLRWPKNEFIF